MYRAASPANREVSPVASQYAPTIAKIGTRWRLQGAGSLNYDAALGSRYQQAAYECCFTATVRSRMKG